MPRLMRDDRTLKCVLEWAPNQDIADAQIAIALDKPSATFSRRKRAIDFPSYEELDQIGTHFGINPRWLQVEFGYPDVSEVNLQGQLIKPPCINKGPSSWS